MMDDKEHCVVKKRVAKKCICNNLKTCKGLTAAFCLLDDPRKGFVRIPLPTTTKERVSRAAYLQCIDHLEKEEAPALVEYIAAHHFHPSVVMQSHQIDSADSKMEIIVPRTMPMDEATRLGVTLDKSDDSLQGIVVPNYTMEESRADVMSILAMRSKSSKACLCGNPTNQCKGLTAAFAMLRDPRKSFIRIPRYHIKKGSNEVRQAYLDCLLPDHPIEEETPTKYVAVHHFDPALVLAYSEYEPSRLDGEKKRTVPRTITKQEVMELGLNVDCCDVMLDKELGRLYIAKPNYPRERAMADVLTILNQVIDDDDESSKYETEEEMIEGVVKVVTPCNAEHDDVGDADMRSEPSITAIKKHEEDACESSTLATVLSKDSDSIPEISATLSEQADEMVLCKSLPRAVLPETTQPLVHEKYNNVDDKGGDTTDPSEAPPAIAATEKVEESSSLGMSNHVDSASVRNFNTEGDHQDERVSRDKESTSTVVEESPGEVRATLLTSVESSNADEDAEPAITSEHANDACPTESKQGHNVTDDTEKAVPTRASKVIFGTISVREYPIIPGDNPGGQKGVPLTIDWEHQREKTVKLDKYEESRPKRRSGDEFIIPPDVRREMLRKSGHSLVEIQKYMKKANIIRNQRKSTVGLSHMFAMSETKERLTRGLSNMTCRKRQKEKEREFLESSLRLGSDLMKHQSQRTEDLSHEDDKHPVAK